MWKRKVGNWASNSWKEWRSPLSKRLKTDNLLSHFIYRKREDWAYVLFETHRCLCPISTTVSHTYEFVVSLWGQCEMSVSSTGTAPSVSANHCFHYSCRLLGNEKAGARQQIFGEVIDLRCGDCDSIARDGHVIGCGAAPELMNPISTFADVTCTF